MRPTYETPASRSREREFAQEMEARFGVVLRQMARFYPIDFAAIHPDSGKVASLCELKTRTTRSTQYRTFFLSAKKVEAACSYRAALGLPVTLFVRWTDRVGELRVDEVKPAFFTVGGREDRGDALDVELMAHWPIEQFEFWN